MTKRDGRCEIDRTLLRQRDKFNLALVLYSRAHNEEIRAKFRKSMALNERINRVGNWQ